MNDAPSTLAPWFAIATGIATILGLIFIAVFFAVGQPWGSLNDACIALEAILSTILAGTLHSTLRVQSPALSLFGLVVAGVGALVVTTGSYLVISGKTDYVLAAHYMNFGFGLIGLWLLATNYLAYQQPGWLPRLIQFGFVVAVFLIAGLVGGYGIVYGLGENDVTPFIVKATGIVGFVGWGILFPIWTIWLGRLIHSNSPR